MASKDQEIGELGSGGKPSPGQRPIPKPRKFAPKNTHNDLPIYDTPRPAAITATNSTDPENEPQNQLVRPRDRANSVNSGVRPQPKPRRACSVKYGKNITSVSADSSPIISGTHKRTSMQPTPLVVALTNKLMEQVEAQQVISASETPNPNGSDDKKNELPESFSQGSETSNPNGSDDKKRELSESFSPGSVILRSKSSTFHRPRTRSDPRAAPSYPSPYKPKSRLSQLFDAGRKFISKTPPVRRSSFKKVTTNGTPLPSRPAPPPPKEHQVAPAPKPQNSSAPAPQSFVLSSTQPNCGDSTDNKDNYPEYEDLDKINNDYERLDSSSSSSEEESEPENESSTQQNEYTPPPALPPRQDATKLSSGEAIPPLPPRSTPCTTKVKKHRYLSKPPVPDSSDDDEAEATEDTGKYETIDSPDSDDQSEGYMTMTGNTDRTSAIFEEVASAIFEEVAFDDDQPEDVYTYMDASEYIPPPKDYKLKKKH